MASKLALEPTSKETCYATADADAFSDGELTVVGFENTEEIPAGFFSIKSHRIPSNTSFNPKLTYHFQHHQN